MFYARPSSTCRPPRTVAAGAEPSNDSASFDTFTRARTLDVGLDGDFLMSNGSSLEITPFGDALRVRFSPGATLVLRPDGKGNFVSRDGQIALRYERGRADGPGELSVSLPPGGL